MYFDGKLDAIGSWVEGYRPTMFRITYGESGTLALTLRDVSSGLILDIVDCVSGTAYEIPGFSEDIGSLELGGLGGDYLRITNIEFYPAP
jgi:hypothetical protein